MKAEFGWNVSLANISPAVLIPNGRLLLKLSGGACFGYEENIERITHHMPVTKPKPPPGSKETYEIPYDPEFPENSDA